MLFLSSMLTAVLTIFGGALTLVLGPFLIKAILEPAVELKREIGRIAYSLDFYANRRYSVCSEEQSETRRVFRDHACKLRELANTVLCVKLCLRCFRLPELDGLYRASSELIGHSNFPAQPDGTAADRSEAIRRLLGIS